MVDKSAEIINGRHSGWQSLLVELIENALKHNTAPVVELQRTESMEGLLIIDYRG